MDRLGAAAFIFLTAIKHIDSFAIERSIKKPERKIRHEEPVKWLDEEITPERRIHLEEVSTRHLEALEKRCDSFSRFAPCACIPDECKSEERRN